MPTRFVIAAPEIGVLLNSFGADATILIDRQANGAAFPGERLVRLPRRFARRLYGLGRAANTGIHRVLSPLPTPNAEG